MAGSQSRRDEGNVKVPVTFFAVLFIVAGGAWVSAAELVSWSAKQPAQGSGIVLTRGPGSEWRAVAGAVAAVEVVPVRDYFKRASFKFRLERVVPGPAWLSAGFLDRGYGVLTPTVGAAGKGVAQRDAHGAAILNSGKLRHAVFHLPDGADTQISITGARFLHSIEITDTKPELEALPGAEPAFRLRRPMDLVITAGADAPTADGLPDALASLRNQLPLMKALGFNGIESYVKWNFVERSPGVFDWSYYDAIVAELEKHGMKWFPLLIVGSAYALPDWFYSSPDNIPFVCLEHNRAIEIPSIFGGTQERHVRRFLNEFGKHYAGRPPLVGIRLGPSGNYGEAQYPATGAWGYKGRPLHTHIGYWAGDPHANADFRHWLARRYAAIEALNKAWDAAYKSFDEIRTFLPVSANTPRMRHDFSTWYIDAMSGWCERWAEWAREAVPGVNIYQSSGGWGAIEIGTDYAAQAKAMGRLGGGIRMTNENDSYLNNFGNTRLAASAARFYGAKWGTEPAGFSSMRGVVGRLYNALVNHAEHLFYYEGNLTGNDQAIPVWLKYAPLLDGRAKPLAPVAVFYNDTANKLRDDTLRHLRASAYLQRVHALRSIADFDLVSEQMIADGALSRYKALIMIWGNTTEKRVADRIAAWVDEGGALFYPDRELSREGPFQSLDGDATVFKRWQRGETGKGRVLLFSGQSEPFSAYVEFVRRELPKLRILPPAFQAAFSIRKPEDTFWTVLEDGRLALLNYGDATANIWLPGGKPLTLEPYSIRVTARPRSR
jgi:hypothetical protein